MTEQATHLPTEPTGLPTSPTALPAQPPAITAAPVEAATETVVEPVAEVASAEGTEEVAVAAPAAGLPTSRPAVASRKARRPAGGARKITRYTLDLEAEMHRGLRLFSVQHEVTASVVMRSLLWILMANQELPAGATLADLVLDEIFSDEDEVDEA